MPGAEAGDGGGEAVARQAVEDTVEANGGFRAVRAVPSLKDGRPVAEVTLMQGGNVKRVSEKLD